MYIPPGPARPDEAAILNWRDQLARARDRVAGRPWDPRWIGLDDASTEQVIGLIERGDKTGTFTLPWILDATGQAMPAAGDLIVLVDFRGQPRLLLQLTAVTVVRFGAVGAQHTAIDGTPVRRLDIWRPLHTRYWNELLEPFGRGVEDDMPVLVERFVMVTKNQTDSRA